MEPDALIPGGVEHALAKVWGGRPRLAVIETLPVYESSRARVLRCEVRHAAGDAPGSVVVKYALGEHEVLFHEWAALEFLADEPELIAGSVEGRWIVTGDLGHEEGRRLGLILMGTDRDLAGVALLAHQRALGRMHAETAGRADEFRALRAKFPGCDARTTHRIHEIAEALSWFPELLASLGVAIPRGLRGELAAARYAIGNPGSFEALVHGDPTFANSFFEAGRVRFIDFETCAIGHALLDGAFARIRYLHSVWAHAIPEQVQRAMLAAYRAELGIEDGFDDALLACSAGWMAGLCRFVPRALEQDGKWGRATLRQRIVAGLAHFRLLADESGGCAAVREAAHSLEGSLRERWAGSELTMRLYAALA